MGSVHHVRSRVDHEPAQRHAAVRLLAASAKCLLGESIAIMDGVGAASQMSSG